MRTGSIAAAAAIAGLATLASACSPRTTPYRFRADLVGAVNAAEPAPTDRERRAKARPARPVGGKVTAQPRAIEPRRPLEPVARAKTRGERRAPSDASPEPPLATLLRGFVGARDRTGSDVRFAVRAIEKLGAQTDRAIRQVTSGAALVRLARDRGAFSATQSASQGAALLGDLVVFDNVVGRKSASLVGVVVAARPDGTLEFVYLARGVVRRGYVNPRRPSKKRDASGRAINTFVRHSDGGDRRGTRYLAGELMAGVVRLDRLQR